MNQMAEQRKDQMMKFHWKRLGPCVGLLLGIAFLGCDPGSQVASSRHPPGSSIKCGDDVSLCGEWCVHTATDSMHCGGCYNQCASGAACVDGTCVVESASGGTGAGTSGTSSGTGGGAGG